jgi:polyhydroxybutyrate depolymerase
VDDVSYFGAVLDDIAARNTIDATRIYVTGFSNGGMMSYRLACAMSDRIAGIAAVGGASGQFDQSLNQYYSCNPARPIPVLHVHATNDRNYPYAGGYGVGISNVDFYSVDSTIADWIARNNVMAQGVATSVTPTTTCTRYATPADVNLPSAAVTLCREDPPDVYDPATEIVFGGGHSWPGGSRSPSASSDTPLQDFNVNAYMWSYFGN